MKEQPRLFFIPAFYHLAVELSNPRLGQEGTNDECQGRPPWNHRSSQENSQSVAN